MGLGRFQRWPGQDPRIRRNAAQLSEEDPPFISGAELISITDDGFFTVDLGDGLANASGDLVIDLTANSGLEFSSGDLQLDLAAAGGLELSTNELQIKLDTDPGLALSGNGLTTVVQGVIAKDASGLKLNIGSGLENDGSNNLRSTTRQLFVNTADSSAIADTTSETNFDLNYTIPANFLTVGKVLRVVVSGILSDTGSPTITYRLKIGTTTLIDFSETLAGTSNEQFEFEFVIVCTATGATGSVSVHEISGRIAGTTKSKVKQTATIDTTANGVLQLSAQWDTADAANTTTLELFKVATYDE